MPARVLAEKARTYSKYVEASDSIYQGIDKAYEYASRDDVILVRVTIVPGGCKKDYRNKGDEQWIEKKSWKV